MAEEESKETETINGAYVEMADENEDTFSTKRTIQHRQAEETLYAIFHRLIASIFFPDHNGASTSLLHRIKISLSHNCPLLPQASRNTGRNVLRWTRQGSPLRALLVISLGTITVLALTGLLVFTLFFLAATFNAIVISLLMSLAAAGSFLALFLACVTAIYIGALLVAVFVISSVTISAIIAALIATGWIGFFWTVWLVTKKSVDLAKTSVNMTGSALSAYSSARHGRHHHEPDKHLD